MSDSPVNVIDLFAGVGGLSLGAIRSGAAVRLMIDSDPMACRTLRQNSCWDSSQILESDIRTLSGQQVRDIADLSPSEPLIIIGGPPCQPFSKNAYWTDSGREARYRRARARGISLKRPSHPSKARPDDRRPLVGEFWRIVEESKPDAFLFENVSSILHPRNRHVLADVQAAAKSAGFQTTLVHANAADYGVPQRRRRVFLLGARRELPMAPAPTHAGDQGNGFIAVLTAGDAIAHYSSPGFHEPEEVVTGKWTEHLKSVPPGWNYKAHTAWGGHPSPTFETETRFWNFLLKLSPDKPSWTIPANPGPWTGPFHWESRRLRTPELSALQGLPSDYTFAGNRRERVRQIGNAVPPAMAQGMIEQLQRAVGVLL